MATVVHRTSALYRYEKLTSHIPTSLPSLSDYLSLGDPQSKASSLLLSMRAANKGHNPCSWP